MRDGVVVNEPPRALSDRQVALLAAVITSMKFTGTSILDKADTYLRWLRKEGDE